MEKKDKQQQAEIKDLAKLIFQNYNETICGTCGSISSCEELGYDECGVCTTLAEIIYNDGYRKMDDARIFEMQLKNGEVDMTMGGEYFPIFINSLIQTFKQNGAKNFLATTIEVDDKSGEKYALTIQKIGGKSPAEELNELRKKTAKEILNIVAEKTSCDHIAMKQYNWFKELAIKYNVELL